MRISDWSSDVCSSDLVDGGVGDAEIGRQPDQGNSFEAALAQVADEPGRRRPVVLEECGIGIDRLPEALADDHFDAVEGEVRVEGGTGAALDARSEEHTSELQSPMRKSYVVLCLKKKQHI